MEKTLTVENPDDLKEKVGDVFIVGDPDTFKLISKASSQAEGWMKSTKAMYTGNGCVVQVTTQQRNPDGSWAIAEALTFVPNVAIIDGVDGDGNLAQRMIVPFDQLKAVGVEVPSLVSGELQLV